MRSLFLLCDGFMDKLLTLLASVEQMLKVSDVRFQNICG